MRKDEIVVRYHALVERLEEAAHQVIVGGSAALVLLGVKERTDVLEVFVEPNVFKWAVLRGGRVCLDDPSRMFFGDNVFLCTRDMDRGVVCTQDEIWVFSPSEMLVEHRKDLQDIKAEVTRLETLVHQNTFMARRI